jgi:Flp pilus assembly protein protease CpaA
MTLTPWVLAILVALAGAFEVSLGIALYHLGRAGTEDVNKKFIRAAIWFTASWKTTLVGTMACLLCVIPVVGMNLYFDAHFDGVSINQGISETAGFAAIAIVLATPFNIAILWKRYWERTTGRWFQ